MVEFFFNYKRMDRNEDGEGIASVAFNVIGRNSTVVK